MEDGIKVIVNCPCCGKRVVDKVGKGNVNLFMKCPHCKEQIQINLALRLNRSNGLRYRLAY